MNCRICELLGGPHADHVRTEVSRALDREKLDELYRKLRAERDALASWPEVTESDVFEGSTPHLTVVDETAEFSADAEVLQMLGDALPFAAPGQTVRLRIFDRMEAGWSVIEEEAGETQRKWDLKREIRRALDWQEGERS